MITLDYKDQLTNNPFRYANNFHYNPLKSTGIYYKDDDPEKPFIMTGRNGLDYHGKGTELMYSTAVQFSGKVLTSLKIKEVLDSARVLLKLNIGNLRYLIGKGFMARVLEDATMDVLFMAMVPSNEVIGMMLQVRYYVSRNIYLVDNKRILPVIKDFMSIHKGDVYIANDISRFLGHKIIFPPSKTLGKAQEYKEFMMDTCMDYLRKKFPLAKSSKFYEPTAEEKLAIINKEREKALKAMGRMGNSSPFPEAVATPVQQFTVNTGGSTVTW